MSPVMSPPLSDNGRNAAVNGLGTAVTYLSLHTADPATTGTAEVTGGTPAYARKACTWGAAASGSKNLSASVTFDVPAGVTVSHFGTWSAATAGTFYGGDALRDGSNNPVTETFGGQGTYTMTTATLTINAS
jgi:hypothetical protein